MTTEKFLLQSGEDVFELRLTDIENLDILHTKEGAHIIHDAQSLAIDSISTGTHSKEIIVSLEGQTFTFDIKDVLDQLMDDLGMDAVVSKVQDNIKAPMPGLILDILVEEGDSFEEGDALLILEAMKMENVLKAEAAGKVKAIHFEKGQTVDKSQIIIELDVA